MVEPLRGGGPHTAPLPRPGHDHPLHPVFISVHLRKKNATNPPPRSDAGRQEQRDARPSRRLVCQHHLAPKVAGEAADERQTEAGAVLAGAEERPRRALESVRWKPGTVVGHLEAQAVCLERRRERDAARLLTDGGGGVEDEIQERLSQAIRGKSDRETWRDPALEPDPLRHLVPRQRQQITHELLQPQLARRLRRVPGAVEQLIQQARQPLHLDADAVQPLGYLGIADLGAQVLQRHLNSRQRVAQLVRHAGRQLARRRQPLGPGETALLFEESPRGGADLLLQLGLVGRAVVLQLAQAVGQLVEAAVQRQQQGLGSIGGGGREIALAEATELSPEGVERAQDTSPREGVEKQAADQ